MGDDTPALKAVLDADVWRKHLLAEQERITKELAAIESRPDPITVSASSGYPNAEREELDTILTDIHSKLAEMEADKAESRAASILAGLGFSQERQQHATKTFSGGWRMRLALARALFCKPDLLLLDEPSNMLDVPSITFLSEYLQDYPSTVLVVSHDRAFLNEVATDIIHQHSERLDYYKGGNFDAFYATKEERRKTAKREYENQMAYRKHLQTFIDKFRYNAAKSSEAQSRIKKLEKLPKLEAPDDEYTVVFKFPEVEKLSPPIIQMTNVSFSYTPGKPIVEKVDLDVQLDSRIGIVGPNGAGKTTVLKLLIGQLQPSGGLITQNPRLRIGFFAQHHVDALDLTQSAVGFCAKMFPGRTDEEYRRHLGAFGITGTTGLQKMALLSGGQKSRVAFSCLSLTNPHILVCLPLILYFYIFVSLITVRYLTNRLITWMWRPWMRCQMRSAIFRVVYSWYPTTSPCWRMYARDFGCVITEQSRRLRVISRHIRRGSSNRPIRRGWLLRTIIRRPGLL